MAQLPAIPYISPEATTIIAVILVAVGLAMAFWGHGIWASVMSMLGALLGSAVGFLFGAAFGYIPGLVLAVVGAIIGSILFSKLVKVALAFGLGLLAGVLVYSLLRGSATFTPGQLDAPLIGAILVMVVVFALSFYYIDDIIGIVTAAVGGLLLAGGLYLLTGATLLAGLAGLGAFVVGAIVQTTAIKRKRRAKEMAQAYAAQPYAPPPPPPP